MAGRNRPYEQFGPFILFKKLEADALGDLWRAGRIDAGHLGPTVALRRLSGGHREALLGNTHAVSQVLPRLSGTSFVRDQQSGAIDGIPYLAWEYGGGRSLRHIIDRARGGKDSPPNPLPIDQAIVIAEKIALSLATMADFRETSGGRLCHGALIPQFVWIADDGEIRVAAQQLGSGLIASLGDPKTAAELARYFPPEHQSSGRTSSETDIYSMGAILFLIVTGQEPPDAATASAFVAAVRGAKTMAGEPIPDDIRVVLDKSLNIDPSMRFPSIAEMKHALSALAQGRYAATTFNLAFYLSNLLKKELETEAVERGKETKVDIAPYLEAPPPEMPGQHEESLPAPAMFATSAEAPRSRSMLIPAVVILLLAAIGAGAYVFKNSRQQAAVVALTAPAKTAVPATPPPVISEPVVALPADQELADDDALAEAQKRAFDEAVRQKLQAEMMKLQNAFLAELQEKQARSAPVASPSPTQAAAVEPALSPEERATLTAAQLEQQRREAQKLEAEERPAAPAQQAASQPAASSLPVATATPQVTPVGVREGDVVDVALLDTMPRPTRAIRPVYPPIAARQKVAATIILTAFVTETGDVSDVRVLRGDPRFGFNDAAIRAMRATKFSSPMKDGKRVRTWLPQTIEFNPN